jgi:hypothetical protein
MTDSATPICDLIERLLSHDCPAGQLGQALAAARPVEAAMMRVATTASTAIISNRERERLRKADYRARLSHNVPRDTVNAIPSFEEAKTQIPNKKESKKDAVVPPVPGTSGTKRGSALPETWSPDDVDHAYGDRLGITPRQVDACAEDMRLWAKANSNRAVGRKADWRSTFHGWMRREAPKLIRQNGGPNGTTQGPSDIRKAGFSGMAARVRYGDRGAEPERPAPEDLQPINRR